MAFQKPENLTSAEIAVLMQEFTLGAGDRALGSSIGTIAPQTASGGRLTISSKTAAIFIQKGS